MSEDDLSRRQANQFRSEVAKRFEPGEIQSAAMREFLAGLVDSMTMPRAQEPVPLVEFVRSMLCEHNWAEAVDQGERWAHWVDYRLALEQGLTYQPRAYLERHPRMLGEFEPEAEGCGN